MKSILYQEISNQLRHDIITGKYPVNTAFPTENDLVTMFSVSKITIRNAVELLVQEGYLRKKSGKGTKVISNRPFNVLNKAIPFSRLLIKEGIDIESEIVEVKESKETSLDFAYPNIYELTRIYSLNGTPAIYSKHFFSLKEKETLDFVGSKEFSLYRFLYDKNLPIAHIKDSFRAIKVDEALRKYVSFSSDLALRRHRFSYDSQEKLVEFTSFIYDSDLQEYYIDYQV
jgi:DNA-binding GntR family transcriptional regulator